VTRRLGRRSLRRKLTLVTMVTIVAAQLCAAIALGAWEAASARRDLIRELQVQSRIMVDNTATALAFIDYEAAVDTLRALGVPGGFENACLYDSQGTLFASHVTLGECAPSPPTEGASFDDKGLVVATAVIERLRGRVGTLSIRSSQAPVVARLRAQMVGTLIVLLMSSVAAIALTAILQRQLTAPLRDLAETAQAVSRDRDYTRRVTQQGDDEVGAVSAAFNDMLSQIQRRDEELRNALRLKDEFLATVSHELRTPLNAMLGWSHILRSGDLPHEMSVKAAEAIDRNARWQARLIEDILDVSRIITGKLRLEPKPTDLVAIIRSAVDVVQPSAKAKKISIELALPAVAPFVGDPDRLRQVIWNLISNAVKFTAQEGQVRVGLREDQQDYVIEVVDSGRGIAPDFLPYIFEPFRQADGSPTRSQGGLGLGLAIARHLTELSGGSIHAESQGAGHGATFTIRFPRPVRTLEPAPPTVEEPAVTHPPWSGLDGHTVLLVDDNEDTRHVLGTILEAHGAKVTAVESVADARTALARQIPDVLITDLAMPVEDGFGLLDYCRHHPDARLQKLPILALTAYGGQQAQERVLAAGFDAYLAKPVEPTEVGRIVKKLVSGAGYRAPGRTREPD
jgi:signal transduction histidine kinase/ActR/RegA family two-component response regulator